MELSQSLTEKHQACDRIAIAVLSGRLGDTVREHENLIVQYYEDVQEQAKRSFNTAILISKIGFGVLIVTLVYALVFDGLHRFFPNKVAESSFTITSVGVVSGIVIEFIAAVAFWLYSRGAKQFGAFHICLERTHRYLLAYKMVEELGPAKDQTLRDLVCIMAGAPMISGQESSHRPPLKSVQAGLAQLSNPPFSRYSLRSTVEDGFTEPTMSLHFIVARPAQEHAADADLLDQHGSSCPFFCCSPSRKSTTIFRYEKEVSLERGLNSADPCDAVHG
jgi:hypothetical protein